LRRSLSKPLSRAFLSGCCGALNKLQSARSRLSDNYSSCADFCSASTSRSPAHGPSSSSALAVPPLLVPIALAEGPVEHVRCDRALLARRRVVRRRRRGRDKRRRLVERVARRAEGGRIVRVVVLGVRAWSLLREMVGLNERRGGVKALEVLPRLAEERAGLGERRVRRAEARRARGTLVARSREEGPKLARRGPAPWRLPTRVDETRLRRRGGFFSFLFWARALRSLLHVRKRGGPSAGCDRDDQIEESTHLLRLVPPPRSAHPRRHSPLLGVAVRQKVPPASLRTVSSLSSARRRGRGTHTLDLALEQLAAPDVDLAEHARTLILVERLEASQGLGVAQALAAVDDVLLLDRVRVVLARFLDGRTDPRREFARSVLRAGRGVSELELQHALSSRMSAPSCRKVAWA